MDCTKKLCSMLDELGVEHETYVLPNGKRGVSWIDGNNIEWEAVQLGENFEIHALQLVTPEQAIAATVGERNPDGLPIGLTVSNDGNLLNWVGENYVRQDAATVGRGNLTAEQVREAIMSADRWRKPMGDTGMTNTHLIIRDDGWQAITDELNATVGAGTCRNKGFVDDGGWYFVCSKCGCEFEYGDFACEFAEGHGLGSPKFCPNCGKKVVSE